MARKGEATRARLLQAAERVVERVGFHEARVSDIAEEAGMVPGGVYHYFDSKEAIFRELVRSLQEGLVDPIDEEAGLFASVTGREGARLSIRRFLRRYSDHAQLAAVIDQVARVDPEVNAIRLASIDDFVRQAETEIRRLQRDGLADPDLDPAIAADALIAMASRFAELWLLEGAREYDFDEAVDALSRLVANALGLKET